jgi:hypothetical protein
LDTPCITHEGTLDKDGYGFKYHEGRTRRANRVAYCIANNLSHKDIKGLLVRHKCDNPACVNPLHLELGTAADNNADRDSRGRASVGEHRPASKLTEAAVLAMRAEYIPRSKEHGSRALAKKYGVHQAQVSNVINRKTWKHI